MDALLVEDVMYPHSTIIFTSPSWHLLKRYNNSLVYGLKGLNFSQSCQLFYWYAFQKDCLSSHLFETLVDRITNMCKGALPYSYNGMPSPSNIEVTTTVVVSSPQKSNEEVKMKFKKPWSRLVFFSRRWLLYQIHILTSKVGEVGQYFCSSDSKDMSDEVVATSDEEIYLLSMTLRNEALNPLTDATNNTSPTCHSLTEI
eukprot:Gb_39018 [translate_table: standard]